MQKYIGRFAGWKKVLTRFSNGENIEQYSSSYKRKFIVIIQSIGSFRHH
jgi:hypothetical protein